MNKGKCFIIPLIVLSLFFTDTLGRAANPNLFVSAENSQFDNYMSGPQVIEVVIIDSDINDTDELKGEPNVTVNGKILRMIQAVDGNWYGYFADRDMAQTADATTDIAGAGLDFGSFCANDFVSGNVSFSDADAIAVSGTGGSNGLVTPAEGCVITPVEGQMNVLREAKDINTFPDIPRGQIGLVEDHWPIIQLYDLNPTGNVIVQYNKGGGVQTTTLTFDTAQDFADLELDRSLYGKGMQVHVTVTDLWLNIDPTDEDSWTFAANANSSAAGSYYQVFDENGNGTGDAVPGGVIQLNANTLETLMCDDNCMMFLNPNQEEGVGQITLQDNDDSNIIPLANEDISVFQTAGQNQLLGAYPVTVTEQGPNSGVFSTSDESDVSSLWIVNDNFQRGQSATIDYNDTPVSVLTGFSTGSIDIQPIDDEWNSGEEIPVVVIDQDLNLNSRADEDLDLFNPDVDHIPTLQTGHPITLENINSAIVSVGSKELFTVGPDNPEKISQRVFLSANGAPTIVGDGDTITLILDTTFKELYEEVTEDGTKNFRGINLVNFDVRSIVNTVRADDVDLAITDGGTAVLIADHADAQSLINLTSAGNDLFGFDQSASVQLIFTINGGPGVDIQNAVMPIVVDFFSFGFFNDGVSADDRVANQIIRLELEESGDNTGEFEGSLKYTMINQLNILDAEIYERLSTIADDPTFIVMEDLTDDKAPRVNYLEIIDDGEPATRSDQEEAPSHSGTVTFNSDNYKIGDTVTITLKDQDLNIDSKSRELYSTQPVGNPADTAFGSVGEPDLPNLSFGPLGRLLDVTFDDVRWRTPQGSCSLEGTDDTGLDKVSFTLEETNFDSGVFVGDFQIPDKWCRADDGSAETTMGLDIEVNYVDFRDASDEIIEVGDSAGVRANTGSISLDRTVYPVPFGEPANFTGGGVDNETTPSGRSLFPIHQTGMNTVGTPRAEAGLQVGEFLPKGDLTVHIRVNDPDFDVSAAGIDMIAQNIEGTGIGPVKISVIRGDETVVLGYAGGPVATDGRIDVDDNDPENARQFGPMVEIAPDAGIFEIDISIAYTDGPANSKCPPTTHYGNLDGTDENDELNRFDSQSGDCVNYSILRGDIIQVEYTDPVDASGGVSITTDSATFDLRNCLLQSDKSVYIIGSDMILTLIEPDLDLDNAVAEMWDLDLIEWDSDAATITMGDADGEIEAFDPEPTTFRETGNSTGIFQAVFKIPEELDGDRLERGEEIILEYTDWGPAGSDFVGEEEKDVNLTLFTSNFGATVELDKKVYSWTDKIFITIVAPDHNFDSDLIDEIGDSNLDCITISTKGFDLKNYKLVETGTDTGIFTGEVILTGFAHDADGDETTGGSDGSDTNPRTMGAGPTDGLLPAENEDAITVTFKFAEDETAEASALIRWNIGEILWLEESYPANGTGIVRVIDPDMNLDPETVDTFDLDAWSDSDAGGIDLTVTETNEATGIFEATVFFTDMDESSGHRLRVAEGDTITAEYEDHTLPAPFTPVDDLNINATSLIGTLAPAEGVSLDNCRVVDAFGNPLSTLSLDQQVQITCDLENKQDVAQEFAFQVQIQNKDGTLETLATLTGSLAPGQTFSPTSPWIPKENGQFTATVSVKESIELPSDFASPMEISIAVSGGSVSPSSKEIPKSVTALPSVEGVTWVDKNDNGIQEINEPGLEGVEVKLFQVTEKGNSNCEEFIESTIGAEGKGGEYAFGNISPGSYLLEINPPQGFTISPSNQGDNEDINSDIAPTGRTEILELLNNQTVSIDIGLVPIFNLFPTVQIISPQSGQNFTEPDMVILKAKARDNDENGTKPKVEFFKHMCDVVDGQLVCSKELLPGIVENNGDEYILENNFVPGNYIITAVATDNLEVERASDPVNFLVNDFEFTFTRPGQNEEAVSSVTPYTFSWEIPEDLTQEENKFSFDLYLATEQIGNATQLQNEAILLSQELNINSVENKTRYTHNPGIPLTEESGIGWFPHILVKDSRFENRVQSSEHPITVRMDPEPETLSVKFIPSISGSEITYGQTLPIGATFVSKSDTPIQGLNTATFRFTSPTAEIEDFVIFAIGTGDSRLTFEFGGFAPSSLSNAAVDWKAEVFWSGNAKFKGTHSESFQVTKSPAVLVLFNLGSPHLLEEGLFVSGALSLLNGNPGNLELKDITVNFIVKDPDDNEVDTSAISAVTDEKGHFDLTIGPSIFNQVGDWTLQAQTDGNTQVEKSSSEVQRIPVRNRRGYAILCQGSVSGREGLTEHRNTLNFVRDTLMTSGQISNIDSDPENDDIFEIIVEPTSPAPDDKGFKELLKEAIETWAVEKLGKYPAPLYISLVNHGNIDQFHLQPEIGSDQPRQYYLTSGELNRMLSRLESKVPTRMDPIILNLGMCFSGSFIKEVSGSGRIIISSAAENERSIRGPGLQTFDNPDDALLASRQGEYFVYLLFHEFGTGSHLLQSFIDSRNTIGQASSLFDLSDPPSELADQKGQHPFLDDNGDMLGSHTVSGLPDDDGAKANSVVLRVPGDTVPIPTAVTNDPTRIPSITRVNPSIFLNETETFPLPNNLNRQLWAEIDATPRADREFPIRIEIKDSEDITMPGGTISMQADLELDCQRLEIDEELFNSGVRNRVRYLWKKNVPCEENVDPFGMFEAAGVYEVFFNVVANEKTLVQPSVPFTNFVYRSSGMDLGSVQLISPPNCVDDPAECVVVDFVNDVDDNSISDSDREARFGKFTWMPVTLNSDINIQYIFRLWHNSEKNEIAFESSPLDVTEFWLSPAQVVSGIFWWDVVAVTNDGNHSENVTNETRRVIIQVTNDLSSRPVVARLLDPDNKLIPGKLVVTGKISFMANLDKGKLSRRLDKGTYQMKATVDRFLDQTETVKVIVQTESDADTALPVDFHMRRPNHSLLVKSQPDIDIQIEGSHPGETNYDIQSLELGTHISLKAPRRKKIDGQTQYYYFTQWEVNGDPQAIGQNNIDFELEGDTTTVAFYDIGDVWLEVYSIPFNQVDLADNSNSLENGELITDFKKILSRNTEITLTAPTEFDGSEFKGWVIREFDDSGEEVPGGSQIEPDPNNPLALTWRIANNTEVMAHFEAQWSMEPGWNLISTPVDLIDADGIRSDLMGITRSPLWQWQDGNFNVVDELGAGVPIWLYVETPSILKPEGTTPDQNADIEMKPGWNLFAVKDHLVKEKMDNDVTVWTWDRHDQRYITTEDESLLPFEKGRLLPGQGYWKYEKKQNENDSN